MTPRDCETNRYYFRFRRSRSRLPIVFTAVIGLGHTATARVGPGKTHTFCLTSEFLGDRVNLLGGRNNS